MADSEIIAVLNRRDDLLQKQQELYVEAITNINMRYRQLLTNDFGATLANNCVRDMAGEFVRNYFDTSNFYITADQLAYRILHFRLSLHQMPAPRKHLRSPLLSAVF